MKPPTTRWRAVSAAAVGAALLALALPAALDGASADTNDVLGIDAPAVQGATDLGPAPSTTRLDVMFLMRGQNPQGLSQLMLAQAHDQAAPLTPSQFDDQFGATAAQGDGIRQWLAGGGVTVPDQPLGSRTVFAYGTLAQFSSLLGTGFDSFAGGSGTFVSNTTAPSVPAGLGITDIAGLNTSVVFQTMVQPPSVPTPPSGVPLGVTSSPQSLWKFYNQPAANLAQGQQVATLLWGSMQELDPTVPNDLLKFEDSFTTPLPHVAQSFILQDGYVDPTPASDSGGSGLTESDLDAQASTGMAPDVSTLKMYYADQGDIPDLTDVLNKWVEDPNGALQLSASFGGCESIFADPVMDASFQQADSEGRTVFVSSGDTGAGCESASNGVNSPLIEVEYPASSPFVVAVGGTVVTDTTHTSSFAEYAWESGGGGYSNIEPAAPYQANSVGTAWGPAALPPCVSNPAFSGWVAYADPTTTPPPSPAPSSTSCRSVPDVSAQSGDLTSGYNVIINGTSQGVLGTSLSAPLWQGMWARVSAAAPAGDSVGRGFAAPLLYAIGDSSNPSEYQNDFFDITQGDDGPYAATPGFDQVTGWGSPNLTNLMGDLDGTTNVTCTTNCNIPSNSGSGTGTGGGGTVTYCTQGTNQISGQSGQATSLAGLTDTSALAGGSLSQQDLDILSGNLSWDSGAQTLTARIGVENLTASPPTGLSTDEFFRYLFTVNGQAFELTALRTETATQFAVEPSSLNGSSNPETGSFDPSTNTITVTMPAADLAKVGGSALANGQSLTGMSIDAQRYVGSEQVGGATLTADTQTASCVYQLKAPVDFSQYNNVGTASSPLYCPLNVSLGHAGSAGHSGGGGPLGGAGGAGGSPGCASNGGNGGNGGKAAGGANGQPGGAGGKGGNGGCPPLTAQQMDAGAVPCSAPGADGGNGGNGGNASPTYPGGAGGAGGNGGNTAGAKGGNGGNGGNATATAPGTTGVAGTGGTSS